MDKEQKKAVVQLAVAAAAVLDLVYVAFQVAPETPVIEKELYSVSVTVPITEPTKSLAEVKGWFTNPKPEREETGNGELKSISEQHGVSSATSAANKKTDAKDLLAKMGKVKKPEHGEKQYISVTDQQEQEQTGQTESLEEWEQWGYEWELVESVEDAYAAGWSFHQMLNIADYSDYDDYLDNGGEYFDDDPEWETEDTPRSSAFSVVSFDYVHRELWVMFRESGSIYAYYDVPIMVYFEFMDAESMGSYYNQHIKGQYDCERIK